MKRVLTRCKLARIGFEHLRETYHTVVSNTGIGQLVHLRTRRLGWWRRRLRLRLRLRLRMRLRLRRLRIMRHQHPVPVVQQRVRLSSDRSVPPPCVRYHVTVPLDPCELDQRRVVAQHLMKVSLATLLTDNTTTTYVTYLEGHACIAMPPTSVLKRVPTDNAYLIVC
jgi:hypothetical protein